MKLAVIIAGLSTLGLATAARAEVYGVTSTGTLVDLTIREWQPPEVEALPEGQYQAPPEGPMVVSARLRPHISSAASRYGISEALIAAVAWTESRFREDAISPAGALGVMQLMPSTARLMGVSKPLDPAQNIAGGSRYLRMMLDRFGNDLELALAAYNAGPGAVERHGGVPPYEETRTYVRRVLDRLSAGADGGTH